MPKLKVLSGKNLVNIFQQVDFEIAEQRGSHIKLRRFLNDGTKQILTIPNHDELDKGTIKAIYRQALRYISENELKRYFYSE
ncbi:MAG: type II toxin-antitoxin system HicA family toxin [Bacteroidetes bacterium]|nr:type II toxin-antitoxin system HicA family toxin [Bacteroidota bacterium]MBU2585285.1 type II toxin-antitoxin system HicA family toxin [Bacteroidota bacterium]